MASPYSYVGIPSAQATSSPITGQATRLVPVPSYSAQMATPVAAVAAPVAGNAARSVALSFLGDFLGNLGAGAVQAGVGAVSPPESGGGSNSRFMITLSDVRNIQEYVNRENFLRGLMGRKDLLNADEIIRERESQLRRSAAEAGAREYAVEQLKQQGAIQSALAQTVGQGLASSGGVLQQGIASTMARPDYGSIISEVGRAF